MHTKNTKTIPQCLHARVEFDQYEVTSTSEPVRYKLALNWESRPKDQSSTKHCRTHELTSNVDAMKYLSQSVSQIEAGGVAST